MVTTYLVHPPPFTPRILRGHQYNPHKPTSTYHLLFLNPNGLSYTGLNYGRTHTIVDTAHQFQPDAILCAEIKAFMGNVTIRKGDKNIFNHAGNGESLLSGYNTYRIHESSPRTYPTSLAGGVCQWFWPKDSQ